MNINYSEALSRAIRQFQSLRPEDMAGRAGARLGEGCILLHYLGREYRIPADSALPAPVDGAPCSTGDQILILHYLTNATGVRPSGEWIPFRDLPGGSVYDVPFHNRVVRPLVSRFGRDPEAFEEACRRLGGLPGGVGHCSFVVRPLPMIPVLLVLWEGDDELPPSGNVLFDRTAGLYLPTEDIAVLASRVVHALK